MTLSTAHPQAVVEGALPADAVVQPLPEADQVSTIGFVRLLDRAVGLLSLVALVPGVLGAREQAGQLAPPWLFAVGGALLAAAILMPVYAWSRRGIRPLAGLYGLAVGVGVCSWPWAWTGPGRGSMPWIATLIVLGVLCAGLATSTRAAVVYGLVIATALGVVRTLPSGGGEPVALALQDALIAAAEPIALLGSVQFLRQTTRRLDETLGRRRVESASDAVNRALVDERRRLDAIVHDEVMTTLVAATREGGLRDPHVANLALTALESLTQAEPQDGLDVEVSADQLVRLVKDVANSVCPRAEVLGEIPSSTVTLPQGVVRVLLQAAREAMLNAEKHAHAARVQVVVEVAIKSRRVVVNVRVLDDGRGFDVDAVAPERLGLRLAIYERMLTIRGTASVSSRPGQGTSLALTWSGERQLAQAVHHATINDVRVHPLFVTSGLRLLGYLVMVTSGTNVLVGLLAAPLADPPRRVVGAVLFAIGGLSLLLPVIIKPVVPDAPALPLARWKAALAAAAALASTTLSLGAVPATGWPPHATWFMTPVLTIVMFVFGLGRPRLAWSVACAHALIVALVSPEVGGGIPAVSQLVVIALAPAAGLIVMWLLYRWLDSVWDEIGAADEAASRAAAVNAALFSKLVLREVWQAELRASVGPVLTRIANDTTPISASEKVSLLALEASLRDGIKASNFSAPSLSAAIMEARLRGVTVTLIDNRGSALPEAARRATLRQLERLVRAQQDGRVVARTAPSTSQEAVTILVAGRTGDARLLKIYENGSDSDQSVIGGS